MEGGSQNGEVISSSCLYSRLVHRDHSSVGMSHKTSVGSVSMTSSVDSRDGISVHSTVGDRSSNNRSSSSVSRSLSSKVISTGSSHSRLVSRDHSSIRMGNQVSVQVEGSRVSVASSVSMVGRSNHTNRSSGIDSTMSDRSGNGGTYSVSNTTKLQGEMVSTSCCYSRFIYWDHSTIRVTDQAMETVGHREGKRGENLSEELVLDHC